MVEFTLPRSDKQQSPSCPRCHTRLVLDDLQPGAHRFDPVASAIVDQLLIVQGQLSDIKHGIHMDTAQLQELLVVQDQLSDIKRLVEETLL